MDAVLTLAQGLAWDPQIRGILAVLVGFVVLGGATYLILATNVGARLGLLVAMAGLFGFIAILGAYWWINPPGIGPAGELPFWEVKEVHVTGSNQPPVQREAQFLPPPGARLTPEQVLDQAPGLEDEFLNPPSLSDVADEAPALLPPDLFGGWRVVPTAEAGEAQAAADEGLISEGIFAETGDFEHISVFSLGGKTPRDEVCSPDDQFFILQACRAWYRVRNTFTPNPTLYSVVEVQAVIPQEAQPGQAPPRPVVDEDQPAIWVVLQRQLGSLRVLPFTYFLIGLIGFVIFATLLHYRDKTLQRNLEEAARTADSSETTGA